MHLLRAYLEFDGASFGTEDRGMQRAIAVGLGKRDVIFYKPRHGFPRFMDNPERRVAILDGFHDNADREEIVDFINIHIVFQKFSVQRIGVLCAGMHVADMDIFFCEFKRYDGF